MAGKSPAGKSTPPKASKPAKGTKSAKAKASDSPRVAPELPRRQDLGIGNLRPEHVAAIRRAAKSAPSAAAGTPKTGASRSAAKRGNTQRRRGR